MFDNNYVPGEDVDRLWILTSNSYFSIQLRFVLYTFSFWLGVFFVLSHKYELIRVEKIVVDIVHTHIANTKHYQRLNQLKERFFFARFNIQRLNDYIKSNLRILSELFSYMNRVNSSIRKRNKEDDANGGANKSPISLAAFLFQTFKEFIMSLQNLKLAVFAICNTLFALNFKKILNMPIRLKTYCVGIIREIKSFWIQIEQIIQILRLPIELLGMIGRFVQGLRSFLQRLERPHIRWTNTTWTQLRRQTLCTSHSFFFSSLVPVFSNKCVNSCWS